MNKKRAIFIILTILWMVTIFSFSSQNSDTSSNTSSRVIKMVVKAVSNVSQEQEENIVEQLQHIVRKMAHFSIYAVGGILLFHLSRTYTKKHTWAWAWAMGTVYAITDELHQYFVPGRSCELRDVIIDSSGVITGIIMVILIRWAIRTIKGQVVKKKGK